MAIPFARTVRIPTENDVRFTNWSGSMSFTASRRVRPRGEDDVVSAIRRAGRAGQRVRPVGSGHSSTPLVATGDVLMSLDALAGVVGHDTQARLARVLPGTGMAVLGEELADVGLALENYGDVNYQAIAGALGTGTHGTGETLGNLSSTSSAVGSSRGPARWCPSASTPTSRRTPSWSAPPRSPSARWACGRR